MGDHAKLSPSGADRWMTCAGSVAMENGLPDTSSDYADEGTAAHFLASVCLNEATDPVQYFKRVIVVHTTGAQWGGGEASGNDFAVNEEMVAAVRCYVNAVREYAKGQELMVEQRVPIDHLTGEQGAEGTADAIVILEDELQIHDLKYGRGVAVTPDRNRQEMIYGLGALEFCALLGHDPKRVRLVIHQPRLNTAPQEWDCTVEELRAFGETVKQRAFHAMAVLMNEKPGAIIHHLTPSDDACKWCKAKATCPALAAFVKHTVGAEFEDLTTADATAKVETVKALVPVEGESTLGTKMDAVGLIEDWCKAIRAKVESDLLGGRDVPGYKLVQGRKGARAWSDAIEAEALLKRFRLKQDEMYEFSLISPTKAEEVLKPAPKRWEKVKAFISQSEGKPSVAPITDKRPALLLKPVSDDFDAIVEEAGADLV